MNFGNWNYCNEEIEVWSVGIGKIFLIIGNVMFE